MWHRIKCSSEGLSPGNITQNHMCLCSRYLSVCLSISISISLYSKGKRELEIQREKERERELVRERGIKSNLVSPETGIDIHSKKFSS